MSRASVPFICVGARIVVAAALVASAGCAVKLNGKTYGTGGGAPASAFASSGAPATGVGNRDAPAAGVGNRDAPAAGATGAEAAFPDDTGGDRAGARSTAADDDADRGGGSGTCSPVADRAARDRGLIGPCWDPPGTAEYAPPVHVVPGLRKRADDVYWLDMPREAQLDGGTGCAEIPSVTRGNWLAYEPYAEGDGRTPPRFPDLTGMTVDQALAALDALDAPLCVSIIAWSMDCDAAPGLVCQQNFYAPHAAFNVIVRAAPLK